MTFVSPYKPSEVINILKEQIDKPPSFARCVISLDAHQYSGTSKVCGIVQGSTFELRNRKNPGFSLKAIGKLNEIITGCNGCSLFQSRADGM